MSKWEVEHDERGLRYQINQEELRIGQDSYKKEDIRGAEFNPVDDDSGDVVIQTYDLKVPFVKYRCTDEDAVTLVHRIWILISKQR